MFSPMNIVKTCTANLDGLRIMYLKKHPPVIFMLFLIFQDGMKFIYFNIKFTLEGCNEFSRYSLFLNLWTGQLLSSGLVQCGYMAPTELESPRRVINLYIIIQVQSVSSTYDVIKAIASIWHENDYAWIFVSGHYLFQEAHSFPRQGSKLRLTGRQCDQKLSIGN